MKGNCIEKDMFEEGPTPIKLQPLAAHYDGERWMQKRMTRQPLDMNMGGRAAVRPFHGLIMYIFCP